MRIVIGTNYNVRRKNSTKSINVGDYNTLSEAQSQMLEHFKNTPKRGNIEYIICEEELQDFDGVIMKVFNITLSGNGKSTFYKRYTRQEIEVMAAQNALKGVI